MLYTRNPWQCISLYGSLQQKHFFYKLHKWTLHKDLVLHPSNWCKDSTPETPFVDVSCILLVTWEMWHSCLQGIFCFITEATSSWSKRHWTLLEYTPSHLSWCSNCIHNLVQTWGVEMYTDIAVSSDTFPIWPLMSVFVFAVLVWADGVYVQIRERRYVVTIFHLFLWPDSLDDMIWWYRSN